MTSILTILADVLPLISGLSSDSKGTDSKGTGSLSTGSLSASL